MMKKYPRTFHFQFSPEVHDDDKVISFKHLGNFLQDEVIITEKLDGSNSALKGHQGVFGRSHALPTKEPWYDHLKGLYYSKMNLINPDYWYFGENTFAIHSIEYTKMDSYFYIFAIYDSINNLWLSYDDMVKEANRVEIPLVPLLFRGHVSNMAEVNKWMDKHIKQDSTLGGKTEGFVMRVASVIKGDKFNEFVAKYVRKGHVQTDEHWSKNWVQQTLKND
jgi:hypothetical protein